MKKCEICDNLAKIAWDNVGSVCIGCYKKLRMEEKIVVNETYPRPTENESMIFYLYEIQYSERIKIKERIFENLKVLR